MISEFVLRVYIIQIIVTLKVVQKLCVCLWEHVSLSRLVCQWVVSIYVMIYVSL